MVVLRKDTIELLYKRPDLMCSWMHSLNEMREVLISLFCQYNIHGWQGLKAVLLEFNFEFDVKDLIVFYSRYEVDEMLIDKLLELSLKLGV